jgi:hypothetical protein
MEKIPEPAPPAWLSHSLEQSEAEIAAGRTVPLEPALDRLRASIRRMQDTSKEAPRREKA